MAANINKIRQRYQEIGKLRYADARPIGPIKAERWDAASNNRTAAPDLAVNRRWGERDAIYYVNFKVEIPSEWRGDMLALHLDLSEAFSEGPINTIEGLLSIDGQPWHALDRYHREIILTPEQSQKSQLEISIRVWTGIHEDYQTMQRAELRRINPQADQLYYSMWVALDAAMRLPEYSVARIGMLNVLEAAIAALDFRQPKSADFYASCGEALTTLEAGLDRIKAQQGDPTGQPHVIATGHAHIDVAWLWQLRHTRLKAANTFSTALYHMERYPYFVFTQSQPQLYQYVKDDQPELYERIKQKAAAGQWETEGAMWVEADTNITGGESLVRQFLFGQRFFQQEFGYHCKVLWLPDVFGYSAALPQLIKGAGADYFVTTKISWNDTNRFPNDTFWWQGLDGTSVLTHFITAQNDDVWPAYTYNAETHPQVLDRAWKNYRNKNINNEVLISYGWGDGGGGPTRDMLEIIGRQGQTLGRDLPSGATGKVADFMTRLNERVSTNPQTPRWVGELYLEFHRGTYTSQGNVKKGNRTAERDFHNAEWLASLAGLLRQSPYPREEINAAWRIVLTNQFHDILPGSSIGPVYEDTAKAYAEVAEVTGHAIDTATAALTEAIDAPAGTPVAFNSLSWQRDGLLSLEDSTAQNLNLPQQPLSDGQTLVYVPGVPALGYQVVDKAATAQNLAPPTVSERLMENSFYRIELNERGQITRLLDKAAYNGAGREVLKADERANVLQLFEDKPLNFDAWDIDNYYEQKSWELGQPVSTQVVESGPLRGAVRREWLYEDRTKIVQTMQIYAHSRRIDFATEVDWQERQTLLKAVFPVNVQNSVATADIQWGNLTRPTHYNTSWDTARFETCAHKWFDLSEGDYGVAILNDCKYGYDVHGSIMRQTLLKAGNMPDPLADQGRHAFTYSLFPHAGNWFEGGVDRAAYELNYPLLAAVKTGNANGAKLPSSYGLMTVDAPSVIIETVKQAEDSSALVVRLYECANRRGPFKLSLPFEAAKVSEVNLLEQPTGGSVELTDNGRTIISIIQPYQIKTFLIEPA